MNSVNHFFFLFEGLQITNLGILLVLSSDFAVVLGYELKFCV